MANVLFDKGREGFLAGDIDWDAHNIKLTLLDTADDDPDPAVDDFYDDIASLARVAVSGNFASKTVTAGVANAANVTLTAVTGDVSEEIVIWRDSGVESTSHLIVRIDTATGLPVTPNGGDINVNWDAGVNKIFKL